MDKSKSKQINFRLTPEHARELDAVARKQGKSMGIYAREIVLAHISGFTEFEELSYRLRTSERAVTGLARAFEEFRQSATSKTNEDGVAELRASLATATFRLLTEFCDLESEDATNWVVQTFGVREE